MEAAGVKRGSDFLAGSGELGARIREFPWETTPLGALEAWPRELKTAVSLILGSRHPMWVGWGPEMTFLYNDPYIEVLGRAKHPQALGQPTHKVWEEIWDICGPLADKVYESGEASFLDDVRLFMNRGDLLEETFYSFSYSPIRDEAGRICGLFCPSTDVTPKVLNTRRLKVLSELAASALVEKTTGAACANAAAALGKNPDDIPFALIYLVDGEGGARLEQAVHCEAGGPAAPLFVSLGEERIPWPVGEVLRGGQRMTLPVDALPGLPQGVADRAVKEAVALPVASRGAHEPFGVLVAGLSPCRRADEEYFTFFELIASQIGTAIQNAQAAEEEKKRADMLAEIDRAKTVFFSNVSHEFRTPLTLMMGPLEALLARPEGLRAEDREQLGMAHRNSLRLLRLVNSLLDFSRIEAGRMKAAYEATDLATLTGDLASTFRSTMEAAGLEFRVECPALSAPVYVDREMWEKIVLNLLSNAFKFTFAGRVTVRLEEQNGRAVLTVADTGIGIPEAELPRVFERFHRIEGAKGRTYEGTGIGLALIQELVKLHGGEISAESRQGAGSTFTVALPFGTASLPRNAAGSGGAARVSTAVRAQTYTGEAQTWLPRNGEGRTAGTAARPRILLADDNADMREHVVRLLSGEYEVATAPDGRQALEMIREQMPDLLLSDVMMPELDGLGLLNALRAEPATQMLPVILLTARAGEEMRVEGLQAGADDYLVKPFTENELRARVNAHVQMALARRRAADREAALRAEAEAARDRAVDVLESITDGFVTYDRDWRMTYMNREAERLNGMRREEVLGKTHFELYQDPEDSLVTRELRRAAETREPVEFENYYEPWDRWFHIKAYPAHEGGLSIFYEDVTARKRMEADRDALLDHAREARDEAELLNRISQTLGGELDVEKLVQTVTDAGTKLTGAKFGALFYSVVDEKGEAYQLYTLSGAPREAFDRFGLPRKTPIFEPTFRGTRIVRSVDILQDPDYGKMGPHHGMPKGHLPVRSYLAVPVVSRGGEVLGGLFFAHPEPGVFTERAERLAAGIASHAAIAIDNARLFAKAEKEIAQRKEAESLVRESERRFREMIDALPAAIYTTDAEGRLTHFNPAAVKLSGRVPQLGTDQWCVTWKLYHPDGRPLPHDECPMANALRGGTILENVECVAERPDGSRFWFTPFPTPLFDSEGRITGGINMLVDITERKAAEQALRQSEERFRGVVNSSAIGVAVLTLQMHFLQANEAFCTITGYSEEELKERTCDSLTHEGDLSGLLTEFEKLMSGEVETFAIEKRYIRKDGERIWVQNSVSLLRDAENRPEYIIALSEDITERRRSAEALRESETRFREMAEVGPQFIWVSGADGTMEYVNHRWMSYSGMDLEASRNAEVSAKLVHPDDSAMIASRWRHSLKTGEVFEAEARLRRTDGSYRWFVIRGIPIRDGEGKLVKWFGASTDIEEQKNVEEELRRANQDLEQFAYSASHDLQEPLRSVKIYSELLTKRYRDKLDAQGVEFCDYLRTGATRMEMLVRDLLAYTQVTKVNDIESEADTQEALQDALANLKLAIEESGAQILADSDSLPRLRIHPTHLRQLLQNLIGNAIKYRSPERAPVVQVTAEHQRGKWVFSIRDNGIGIEPEHKERIFGIFKRLHTGEQYSGTGIGLAICQRIVERYQGRIWVESEPGQGSVFVFSLPA